MNPQGFDFRETIGYVSDPANYAPSYMLAGNPVPIFPTLSGQGNICGFASGLDVQLRDKNSGNDARIAGLLFSVSGDIDFKITLPAPGSYNVGLAAGDAAYSRNVAVDLYDGATLLAHLSTGATSGPQRFKDATDTEYTNVTWPTNQTLRNFTFATTDCIFRLVFGSFLTSLYVESAASPDVSVALDGVAATSAAGSPTETAGANISPTGVAGTSHAGSPTISIISSISVNLLGLQASGRPGRLRVGGQGGHGTFPFVIPPPFG